MLAVFLVALSTFHVFASVEISMMIVFGSPLTYQYAQSNSSLSWQECVQFCAEETRCVLAHDNSGTCEWFQFGEISEVAQGTRAQGKIVAFKVISSGTCPDGSDPPTFGQPALGYLETYDYRYIPINVNYTITSTGTSWSFSYEMENSCPPGEYALSPRPAGDWCIQMLYSNVSLSYQQALDACQSVDKSTLTGAANAAEAAFFIEKANETRQSTLSKSVYVRIDGIRTFTCQETPTSSTCMTDGFKFTDPNLNTLEYYNWATSSGAQADGNDNCLVLVWDEDSSYFDVQSCTADTRLPAYVFICGINAWTWT